MELVGERPEGVGYLLKERVGDVAAFVDAVAGSPRAAARSTPRWSPACSAATRGATPCER